MVLLAMLIERMMLRHLINQEGIILFMATIGLDFLLQGFGQIAWGSNVKVLNVGIPDQSFEVGGILLNQFDLFAAGTGAVLVTGLAVLFQKTAIGRALRAVADDHQAALSVGIPLKTIWIIVWAVAGDEDALRRPRLRPIHVPQRPKGSPTEQTFTSTTDPEPPRKTGVRAQPPGHHPNTLKNLTSERTPPPKPPRQTPNATHASTDSPAPPSLAPLARGP